jgi:phenylalanine-4-hydroxylase
VLAPPPAGKLRAGADPFQTFFELLASKQFPVAFIRTREELDYLQEPDIFHEIFGHCPLLTNPGSPNSPTPTASSASQPPRNNVYLARLYWMTIEFGLMETARRRIYGGGILSSPKETVYSLSTSPSTKPSTRSKPCARPTHRHPATAVLRPAEHEAPVRPGPRRHHGHGP